MASLSVNLPWQSLIAPHLPELQAGVARENPGLEVHLVTGESSLLATLDVGDANPAQAAFALAGYVAPMWPALLAGHEVELTVACAGSAWTASAPLMSRLAGGGVAREQWLAETVFDV